MMSDGDDKDDDDADDDDDEQALPSPSQRVASRVAARAIILHQGGNTYSTLVKKYIRSNHTTEPVCYHYEKLENTVHRCF